MERDQVGLFQIITRDNGTAFAALGRHIIYEAATKDEVKQELEMVTAETVVTLVFSILATTELLTK